MQKDLDALNNWCKKWKLKFNVSKCKILSITKCKLPILFEYKIDNIPLERVNSFKDLGVLLQSNLSWNSHVDNIVSKAKHVLGLIKRTVGYIAPTNVKLQLYISLVRSNLEYNTQVWGGLSKMNRMKIESIQRAATRYILNGSSITYSERLLKLNLLPLSIRRDLLDDKFFLKCMLGIFPLKVSNFVNFTFNANINTRSSCDPSLIKPPKCKTLTCRNSYFNRVSHSWNSLPLSIRMSTNIISFSHQIKIHYMSLVPKFNPDCCCCLYNACTCLRN